MIKDAIHPEYSAMLPRWEVMADCYEGQHAIKDKRFAYLPANEGMRIDGAGLDGQLGDDRYKDYLLRALYENYIDTAVKTALGHMHQKAPEIELPARMEPLRERATLNGDSMNLLLAKMNEEQWVSGRLGLLADFPETTRGNQPPYLSMYTAPNIRNWDDGAINDPALQSLNLVVLDESEMVRMPDLQWERKEKYRVLVLGDLEANEERGIYRWALLDENQDLTEELLNEPTSRGQRLDEIPFVFCNTMDLLPCVHKPPLETLGNRSLAIYRMDADYRQHLHGQAQDTLVTKGWLDSSSDGTTREIRVGEGAHIELDPVAEADAKFIGIRSDGLAEQREALSDDRKAAQQMSGQVLEHGAQVESGDAMQRRMTQKNATITDIARTGGEALQKILRISARWMGADPEQVLVSPNLDFSADQLAGADFNQWVAAKTSGQAPIAQETLWNLLKSKGITDFETFQDEIDAINKESEFIESTEAPPVEGAGTPTFRAVS